MSSPPPRNNAGEASKSAMFTKEGLPLDRACFGTALATVDVGEAGPARRVECRPPLLGAAPSLLASKTPRLIPAPPTTSALAFKASSANAWSSLAVGVNDDSLVDDDDDEELVDYFSKSGCGGAPLVSPTLPATAPAVSPSSRHVAPPRLRWNVRECDVPVLPSFYPLERSAVFAPRASAPILASRIAAVLQARSIAASYDSQNAKVDCVSRSHVEFRIRLYRGRGEFDHGIIAEVQRRAGFDLTHGEDVSAILDAAEGKSEDAGEFSPMCHEDYEDVTLDEDMGCVDILVGFESLRVISSILCPQNEERVTVEGRELAMASLTSLTNLERMGQMAVHLSQELLVSETYANLRRVVFSQVGQDQKQTSDRLMLWSLEILANAANNCSQTPTLLANLLSENDHDIPTKLVANIVNAARNPHSGALSCLILRNICVSQVNVEDLIPQDSRGRLLQALIHAASHGGECHANLQRYSQYCLELLV